MLLLSETLPRPAEVERDPFALGEVRGASILVIRLEFCPDHSIQDGQACAMRTRLPEGSRNAQSRTPHG